MSTVLIHKACGERITPGVGAGHVHEVVCARRVTFARTFPRLVGEVRAGGTGPPGDVGMTPDALPDPDR